MINTEDIVDGIAVHGDTVKKRQNKEAGANTQGDNNEVYSEYMEFKILVQYPFGYVCWQLKIWI